MRDLYSVLGIKRTASPEEVKQAFRRQSKLTHPDNGGTEEAFREVKTAFDVLSDDTKRRAYDDGGDVSSAMEGLTRLETILRAAAASYVASIAGGANIDLLAEMRANVVRAIGTKENELLDVRYKMERLVRSRGCVKRRSERGANVFEQAIETAISNARLQILSIEGDLKDGREMLIVLADYVTGIKALPAAGENEPVPDEVMACRRRAARFYRQTNSTGPL